MPNVFQTTRRVEFRDTDAAGIMHFSVFFTLMEQVEHEFLRHLGTTVASFGDHEGISWPRVSAQCDYHAPAFFEDVLDITLTVGSLGNKSASYEFEFQRGSDKIATGRLVAVCCQVTRGEPPRSVPIPDSFRALIGV